MAKVMKDSNHLKTKNNVYIILCIIPAIAVLIGYLSEYYIISIISLGILGLFLSKKMQYGSGLQGEKRAIKLLSKLPDDYYIFNDITVGYDGKESQLDIVVVSKNGVSIVEVKNHKGHITGNIQDQNWVQHKIGRKGGRYTKSFYSPVKQVGTHTYRLSKAIKENGINVWVNNAVYFTKSGTTLDIKNKTGEEMHVYSYFQSQYLFEYLCRESNKKLTDKELEKVLELLNS